MNQYYKAVNEHGNLLYIECFGYMPLLALGGDEDTDNLKKSSDTWAHSVDKFIFPHTDVNPFCLTSWDL